MVSTISVTATQPEDRNADFPICLTIDFASQISDEARQVLQLIPSDAGVSVDRSSIHQTAAQLSLRSFDDVRQLLKFLQQRNIQLNTSIEETIAGLQILFEQGAAERNVQTATEKTIGYDLQCLRNHFNVSAEQLSIDSDFVDERDGYDMYSLLLFVEDERAQQAIAEAVQHLESFLDGVHISFDRRADNAFDFRGNAVSRVVWDITVADILKRILAQCKQ